MAYATLALAMIPLGAYTWKISFHGASYSMPLLQVASNELDIADNPSFI